MTKEEAINYLTSVGYQPWEGATYRIANPRVPDDVNIDEGDCWFINVNDFECYGPYDEAKFIEVVEDLKRRTEQDDND